MQIILRSKITLNSNIWELSGRGLCAIVDFVKMSRDTTLINEQSKSYFSQVGRRRGYCKYHYCLHVQPVAPPGDCWSNLKQYDCELGISASNLFPPTFLIRQRIFSGQNIRHRYILFYFTEFYWYPVMPCFIVVCLFCILFVFCVLLLPILGVLNMISGCRNDRSSRIFRICFHLQIHLTFLVCTFHGK